MVARVTHITRERVEEWSVLVVLELSVELMLPYDATCAFEINQPQDERASRLVVGER